jgi:hypothetical protein
MRIIDKITAKIRLHQAYKNIFNTPDGEIVLQHLMSVAGILNPKITTEMPKLLVREGQRHVVLSILRILGRDSHQLKEQIQESMINETVDEHTDG